MRVPTYKSQSKMTSKTGAINFSVQANPGALSAGSRAMAGLGDLGMKISLDYLETQLKMERTADINKRENGIREKASSLIREAQTKNFTTTEEANSFFNRKWLPISLTATKKITDKVVRTSIDEKLNDLRLIALNDFNKVSRLKIIDHGKSQALKKEKLLIDKISASSGTALAEATDQLYGENGLYASMVSGGLITKEAAEKRIIQTKSKAARLTVNKELSAAAYGQDANAASQIANNLFDASKYPDLSENERVILQKQANTLSNRLTNLAAKTAEKQYRINDKLIKKTQRQTFSTFLLKIRNKEPVTLQKIETLFGDGKLDATQFNTLTTSIIEGDEVASDQGTILDFKNEIYDAQDKYEIDAILDKYGKKIGLGKEIRIEDFISLREFAENQKATTPRAKEAKKLRSLIKQSIGVSGITMPGMSTVRDNLLAADALDTFDRLIDDKDVNGNVRNVRDVYNEVIDQINNTKNEQNFLALNTKSREILGDFDFKNKTEDEVKKGLNKLKQQIEEDTTNFSALEKAIEFETIKHFLKNYKLITRN
jgi:hypothetical protein